ncbi:hypothetical protein IC235_01590 [Hymenobacter sp. BT664]|uniref:Uncharacterized protein n=1 Tax=Hymenobacter montanus TaxID=2771359 RepID=A0A927B9F5_9BACT|nr:hypothetical protein [Hymenobacter montanus]MBD2766582.1 hypothetical protein [Hymenobacter montanus]
MIMLQRTAVHWPAGCAIYAEGLAPRHINFTTERPNWSEWDVSHLLGSPRVALSQTAPAAGLGWAARSLVSGGRGYAGRVELSAWRGKVRSTVVGLAPLAL